MTTRTPQQHAQGGVTCPRLFEHFRMLNNELKCNISAILDQETPKHKLQNFVCYDCCCQMTFMLHDSIFVLAFQRHDILTPLCAYCLIKRSISTLKIQVTVLHKPYFSGCIINKMTPISVLLSNNVFVLISLLH